MRPRKAAKLLLPESTTVEDVEETEFPRYNRICNESLADRGNTARARTHAEFEADETADMPLGSGLACREPMAGQMENDQFPYGLFKNIR